MNRERETVIDINKQMNRFSHRNEERRRRSHVSDHVACVPSKWSAIAIYSDRNYFIFFQPLQIVGIKMSQCVPFASLLLVCYRTISYLIFLFSRFAQYLNFLVQQIQFQIQRFYKKLNKLYLFCCTFFSSILLRFMNALRCRYHFSTVILLYSLFFFLSCWVKIMWQHAVIVQKCAHKQTPLFERISHSISITRAMPVGSFCYSKPSK